MAQLSPAAWGDSDDAGVEHFFGTEAQKSAVMSGGSDDAEVEQLFVTEAQESAAKLGDKHDAEAQQHPAIWGEMEDTYVQWLLTVGSLNSTSWIDYIRRFPGHSADTIRWQTELAYFDAGDQLRTLNHPKDIRVIHELWNSGAWSPSDICDAFGFPENHPVAENSILKNCCSEFACPGWSAEEVSLLRALYTGKGGLRTGKGGKGGKARRTDAFVGRNFNRTVTACHAAAYIIFEGSGEEYLTILRKEDEVYAKTPSSWHNPPVLELEEYIAIEDDKEQRNVEQSAKEEYVRQGRLDTAGLLAAHRDESSRQFREWLLQHRDDYESDLFTRYPTFGDLVANATLREATEVPREPAARPPVSASTKKRPSGGPTRTTKRNKTVPQASHADENAKLTPAHQSSYQPSNRKPTNPFSFDFLLN